VTSPAPDFLQILRVLLRHDIAVDDAACVRVGRPHLSHLHASATLDVVFVQDVG
jgi:hypothetical protein